MSENLPPDGTGESRKKADIAKIPVDPALKESAKSKICASLVGNKFDPALVSLHAFEGEVLRFNAQTILEVRTKTAEKIIGGRAGAPIAVDNEVALKDAINKEYEKVVGSRDMVRKIREVVLNRKDQGFAEDNIIIPLNFWKKDFVIYVPCGACKSSGKLQCQRCHGLGHENCPQCHKKGLIDCPVCRGNRTVPGPGGKPQTCTACQGRGEQTCPRCKQKGEIQCSVCKTKGTTICSNCQGHGWSSHIHMVSLDIRTKFTYDEEVVPDKVRALLERLGPKLKEHAEIEVSQLQDHEDEDETEKKISLHYNVRLPYGHIEFALDKETFYAFLFGHHAKLTYVSPFLDKIIGNGARKLKDAADQRGDVLANLNAAAGYKTVRRAILAASKYNNAKAEKLLTHQTPLGLSKELAASLIGDARRALAHAARKSKIYGLAAGLALAAALLGGYFFVPLRPHLTAPVANESLHILIDGLVIALAASIAAISAQAAGRMTLNKILEAYYAAERKDAEKEKEWLEKTEEPPAVEAEV